jgi:hypothetical protein
LAAQKKNPAILRGSSLVILRGSSLVILSLSKDEGGEDYLKQLTAK